MPTSHTFTVASKLAEARLRPSGEKCTEKTTPVCPSSVLRSFPVRASHTLTVLSALAEARLRPSDEKLTERT